MDSFALVVHDEQTFLARVVSEGSERGIFTRDRADEIIRVSVAMANKYVLQKEIDFRSAEELAKVQETVLKLIGVGLEIKSKGDVEEGVRTLVDDSPVELFRLAYTRIEKLRRKWEQLLLDHKIEILVSPEEYQSLSELAYHRLADMSVFTESELHTIKSLKLEDELFSTLGLVEYYESELARYEFILKLRNILPFTLLNKSGSVKAENLSDVDSIREAFISTLIISGFVEAPDPVSVTMQEVREFLGGLDLEDASDVFPEDLENVVLDLIHELAEDLDEHDASLLTKEIIRTAQKLMETIVGERDTIFSKSEGTFFKRWCRLVILSDSPDQLRRILESDESLDEFDFEILLDKLAGRSEEEAGRMVEGFQWTRLSPGQIIRLFHELHPYQRALAHHVSLEGLTATELLELLDGVEPEALTDLMPVLRKAFEGANFTGEELQQLAALMHEEAPALLKAAGPPMDLDRKQVLLEFKDGSERLRQVLFYACWGSELFPDLVHEAWSVDPEFVKEQMRTLPASDTGPFFLSAAGGRKPKISKPDAKDPQLNFQPKLLNTLFRSLPASKKKAALKFFRKEDGSGSRSNKE
ncbi:MAG: hypothetical protein HY913_10190 [Desulfomonile tiedjei]|nr:hypothetical protein [Desulfomonile tiedjei]